MQTSFVAGCSQIRCIDSTVASSTAARLHAGVKEASYELRIANCLQRVVFGSFDLGLGAVESHWG
jgi:hypothetical protein